MKLSTQIVLVTGSSRGLGLAVAEAFHNEGARVIINYLNNKDAATSIADRLETIAIQADVTDPAQVASMFEIAERHFGRPITTVVNNALADFQFNGDARSTMGQLGWREFDRQIQGSLRGAFNTTQAALPGFEKIQFGRIINIGTNLVQNPVVPYHDYTAAKGALLAFTRTCAAELGAKGVTCNMVSGGLLQVTDASSATPQEVFDHIKAITPLRNVTTPADLAGTVLYFASPWSAAVTGQNVCVDGGLVMC
ncbi:hypothetical protein R6Q59_010057 [Mikania micrantha]